MRRVLTVAATAALVAAGATATLPSPPALAQPGSGFDFSQPQDRVTGLAAPWEMAFLPGGETVLVTQRDLAQIARVDAATGAPTRPAVTIPEVATAGEGGLLGMALHPDFAQNGWVYAYHTAAFDNRIIRFQLDSSGIPQNLQPVLIGIPRGGQIHNGGRIRFGPDGLLYATTGDAGQPGNAQDLQNLGGKILRMTDTGGVPPGNPFGGSLVYSLGHRNVQGLDFDDQGRLWASEFGANSQDEVNLIQAGRNYGWPICEGVCSPSDPSFVDPLHTWSTAEASPSGAAIANNHLFVAALRGQRLWVVPLAGAGIGTPVAQLQGELGRLRAVTTGPDGGLWIMTNNTDGRGTPRPGDDRLVRFPPAGSEPGSCTAVGTVQSQWSNGYVVQPVTVTNTGSSSIGGWRVTFTLPPGHSLVGSWNAQLPPGGQTLTATNLSYNGSLPPGGETSFGFQASRPDGDPQTPPSYTCSAS